MPKGLRIRRSRVLDGLAFCIGVLSFWYIPLPGQLYVVEVLAPALFLLLWPHKRHLVLQRPTKTIILLGLFWLTAQVLTDLYRGTPPADLARGWAAISVFMLLFATLVQVISGDARRMYLLLFGAALGGVLQPFLQPSPYFEAEPWKFGFGPPLALLLVLWVGWRFWKQGRVQLQWVLLLVAFGALSFYLNARSLGGFVALTALLVWFGASPWGRRLAARRLSFSRLLALGGVIVLAGMAVLQSYEFAVARGWLGEQALQKYQMQATGKLGLIIGGRPDVIPAVFAVMDSPIIGHGSWAKDPRYREYLWLLRDLGYERSSGDIQYVVEREDLIPAHSHILQAWVWAGILGALFWVSVLVLVIRAAVRTFRFPHPLFVPVLFFALGDTWNIFFSPFGSMMRFHWAMALTLFLLALQLSKAEAMRVQRPVVGRA